MTGPSIACVIPTHGRDGFLRQAVDSVLRQTTPPQQIIVVDDLGSESTADVVAALARGVNVEVVYVDGSEIAQKSAGASRNLGARHANADFYAFLDDDDWWKTTYLERSLQALRSTGLGWSIAWCSFTKGDYVGDGLTMPHGVAWRDAFVGNPGLTGSNFVISHEAFWGVGGFDEDLRVSNDRDLLIRLLRAGNEYVVVSERLCMQRAHDQGQLTSRTERRAQGLETFMTKYREDLGPRDLRYLKRELYSVRRVCSESASQRLLFSVRQLRTYRPGELLRVAWRKVSRPTMY